MPDCSISVTTDGDTLWLECFAEDPDAETGAIVCPVEPGDSWESLAARVADHRGLHRAQPGEDGSDHG
jgi:hypothetical protein